METFSLEEMSNIKEFGIDHFKMGSERIKQFLSVYAALTLKIKITIKIKT